MSEEIETGVSHIAYFRTDGGSSKLYTQEYVDDLQKQLQQKENIIKEVREYGEGCMNEILSAQIEENPYKFTLYVCLAVHRRYLEILDKGE